MAKEQKPAEVETVTAADVGTLAEVVEVADTPAKFVPKVIKNVTLPLLKPAIGTPIYVKVTGAMFIGKDITARETDPTKKKAPATLVECVNLESGELSQLIVPSVLKGIWQDDYPEDSYVGKGFALTKQEKRPGKEYFPFSVAEIAVE